MSLLQRSVRALRAKDPPVFQSSLPQSDSAGAQPDTSQCTGACAMLMFQNTTSLSWLLPLTPHVGRQPPFICTIGEAALFVEDEIRLGLADDKLWRQSLKSLAIAYHNPTNGTLVLQATRVMQEALYANNLLQE